MPRTEEYALCYRAVLAERPGTILYPTTGLGRTVAERYAHVGMLASEGLIRAAFVDPGSVNLGGVGSDGLPPPIEYVYTNTFADIRYTFDLAVQHQLGPSIAVFEPGFLQVVLAYHEAGALPAGTLVKLYFAAGGYLTPGRPLWGVPPIPEGLDLYLAMLADTGIPWAVAVVGGDALAAPGHPPRARARRAPARWPRRRRRRLQQRGARRPRGCAVRGDRPTGGDARATPKRSSASPELGQATASSIPSRARRLTTRSRRSPAARGQRPVLLDRALATRDRSARA